MANNQRLHGSHPCETCKCDVYCVVAAHARFWNENCDKLLGPWAAPDFMHVTQRQTLGHSGVEVILDPDGTYQLSDTTGG